MEHIQIAALRPNLDSLESKQIKAVVTLIWPYSSSQRQFALLLAESELRLRRKKGQVRVRFSSTSARALATTGVGIGDEVVLSLHGAQFVQDSAVSTPGKSLNWELAYTQTVAISVRRNGAEIANLELIDAVPTPAPQSPTRNRPEAPSPLSQWSSPAFLKHARLSDGPIFEQPTYDPLADESNEGHDKKRRRKSYRDWKAWTCTARTPSPDKEDGGVEDGLEVAMSSPSRPPQFSQTPILPIQTEPMSVATELPEDSEFIEETTIADSTEGDTTVDDGELQKVAVPLNTSPDRPGQDYMRNVEYHDLYARPNEDQPIDSHYDFGGDTELNTDDEGGIGLEVRRDLTNATERATEVENATVPVVEDGVGSTTELATEIEEEQEPTGNEAVPNSLQPVVKASKAPEAVDNDSASVAEEMSIVEVAEADRTGEVTVEIEGTTLDETMPETTEPSTVVNESLTIVMPPPNLSVLHTDFAAPVGTGALTPVGKEPSSPTLKAVDSATLPLPSPFPGDQATSYLDYVSVAQPRAPLDEPISVEDEQEAGSDADYVLENSFFSSISSSKAGGLHQDHETAFTPVRFTFGMDGAGWSRPLKLSSPPPEDIQETDAANDEDTSSVLADNDAIRPEGQNTRAVSKQPEFVTKVHRSFLADAAQEEAVNVLGALSQNANPALGDAQTPVRSSTTEVSGTCSIPKSPDIILLSSEVELDDTEDEDEEQKSVDEAVPESEVKDQGMSEHNEARNSDNDTIPESEEENEDQGTIVHDKGQNPDKETTSDSEEGEYQSMEEYGKDHASDKTVPESEDENSSESDEQQSFDDNTESGADEVQVQQEIPISKQVQQEPHATSSIQIRAEDEQPRPRESNVPFKLHVSAAASKVVDLSSPSAGRSNDVTDSGNEAVVPELKEVGIDVDIDNSPVEIVGAIDELHGKEPIIPEPVKDSVAEPISKDIGNSINTEAVEEPSKDPLPSSPNHLIREPASMVLPDAFEEPQLATSELPPFIESRDPHSTQIEPGRSGVRMESVDDVSSYIASQPETQGEQRTESTTEIMIGIPEEAYKPGEVQSKSVLATSPARNTRPKAKHPTSPSEEDAYISRLSTGMRSTKSKTSSDSTNYVTVSSPTTRTYDATQRQSAIASPSQLSQSPRRSPRIARSTFSASPSVRITSATKVPAQVSSPVLKEIEEDLTDKVTIDAVQGLLKHPLLPSEDYLRSSPPAPIRIGVTPRMPSPVAELPDVQQSATQESNLYTLDDTQQTAMEPPLSFQAGQPDQSLLATPELTQITSASASLHSFDVALPGVQTQPAPHSPTLRTSSRRKPFVTDLSSSPVRESSDTISADDEDATLVSKPDLPSVGLSTPLAYYTPLRDLKYFLNRSSQFHSSSNPDVLAVCMSPSTMPEQAKKGPRHWFTTLHITDLSTYPSITMVNVFRVYQSALPVTEAGDIVLLRAFAVESRKREPLLRSADESSWCVWRYGKPVWGAKKGSWGEMRAREEVKGPVVERGEGEWTEVDKLRSWYMSKIKVELDAQQEDRKHKQGDMGESNGADEVEGKDVEIEGFVGSHE